MGHTTSSCGKNGKTQLAFTLKGVLGTAGNVKTRPQGGDMSPGMGMSPGRNGDIPIPGNIPIPAYLGLPDPDPFQGTNFLKDYRTKQLWEWD